MTAAEYKATRERLGTQAEVAAMLGVNRVTVAKRESGTITREAAMALELLALRTTPKRRKGTNTQFSDAQRSEQRHGSS